MQKKRILIVDDEVGFTRLVRITLESTGLFEVREENNGIRALNTALEFRPDFIFLDVIMPNVDGGDVAAQMQRHPQIAGVPIVFLTAIISQQEAGATESIGGFPFLSKPVRLETMVRCIQERCVGSFR